MGDLSHTHWRKLGVQSLLVMLFFTLFAITSAAQNSFKKPLVVYAVLTDYSRNVATAFTQKTGIPVVVVPMRGSGEALLRLDIEQENPKADVWFGGSVGAHGQAYEMGLLQAYKSAHVDALLPQFRNPLGGYKVNGLYVGILGFGTNKQRLTEQNLPTPVTWNDLLSPKYKGLIGTKNPMISGTAFTTLATLITLKGEAGAFRFVKLLNNNVWSYTIGQTERVIKGDIAIAITFLHEFTGGGEQSTTEFVFPEGGTAYEIGGISLIRSSTQKGLAKQFIDFALSAEGQRLKYYSNRQLSTHKAVAEARNEYQNLPKLVPIDFAYFGRERTRLVQRWYDVVYGSKQESLTSATQQQNEPYSPNRTP